MPRKLQWIELVTGFSCNLRCRVCPSAYMTEQRAMSGRDIVWWLQEGRRRGATAVWLGGGEPTLHPSLPAAIERARRLGYDRVLVQTNGLRLAYQAYADTLVRAGATDVALLVLGADAASHDAVAGHERAFELLLAGIDNLRGQPVRMRGDVLMTTRSAGRLAETVERFAAAGLDELTFWLASMHGLDAQRLAGWSPSMEQVVPELQRAFARAEALGVAASTWHTPPCVLAPEHRGRYVHSGRLDLLVVVPGGEPFMAEASPMEGGVYLEGCSGCAARGDCLGVRADYLRVHGSGAFAPIG